jgi:integrase
VRTHASRRLVDAQDSELIPEHCSEKEYGRFLAKLPVAPLYRLRRARFRREFVERWPRLQDWFTIPLRERIGRLPGEHQGKVTFPTAYNAHSYLYYLCLTERLRIDYPFLLAMADLSVEDIARPLKMDLGIRTLCAEGVQLGYTAGGVKTSVLWVIHRIALHTGIFRPQEIRFDHINELFDAIRQFRDRPDVGSLLPAYLDIRTTTARAWHAHTQKVRVLLHHRGQNIPLPVKTFRLRPVFRARQPALQAAVNRWLALKQVTWARSTYEHVEISLRHFLQHLEHAAPELTRFSALTADHASSFVTSLCKEVRPRTGRPLSISARRARVSAIAEFFRGATTLGWPDVPERPLFNLGDLPRIPARVPRFIPEAELGRLMVAIRKMPCAYQRTALLTARWSGARRGEIARLPLDCLDRYPDRTPRLRIPAGKTSRERLVPLHPEAALALKSLIAKRSRSRERPVIDPRTGHSVRFLFLRRGQRISTWYLFDVGLRIACKGAGLLDSAGRPLITAHRFRHTVGTQLAERGAKLHTIMSVLGHESPHMSMIYARISDAEVLRDYRSILGPGAVIAGRGAEAVRTGKLSTKAVSWLKSNFFKTELELGHCLRLPSEGPCECDLYLTCAKFVTTPAYAPRLRERHRLELGLAEDARKRHWPAEVQRHCGVAKRIECLLSDLGRPMGSLVRT